MISLKLLAVITATVSVSMAEFYGKRYDCENTCAEEIKLVKGYQEDCYEFVSMEDGKGAKYLDKLPRKYEYICKDTIDFINACYCHDPEKKRTYTTEDCDTTTTTDYVLVPTTETTTTTTTDSTTTTTTDSTTTTTTDSTTTTTTTTTTESSCPTDPATCDDPFICGQEVPTCGEQGSPCFCVATTESDNVCIVNFFCNDVPTCTSSTECPSGQRCVKTCCGDGSCTSRATNEQCQPGTQQQGLRMPAGGRVRGKSAAF